MRRWRLHCLKTYPPLRQSHPNPTSGEPFADAYTGWIPESDPHPLTTPDISPLAFTLRAFDEEPGAAASAATAAALAAVDRQLTMLRAGSMMSGSASSFYGGFGGGVGFGGGGALGGGGGSSRYAPSEGLMMLAAAVSGRLPPPRAGAHALFAAWAASRRASEFFDGHTCRRLCFTRSWSLRLAAAEQMSVPLVGAAHLVGGCLPDSSSHPFLRAVALMPAAAGGGGGGGGGGGVAGAGQRRRGSWRPDPSEELQDKDEGDKQEEEEEDMDIGVTGSDMSPGGRVTEAHVTVTILPTSSARRRNITRNTSRNTSRSGSTRRNAACSDGAPLPEPQPMFATGACYSLADAEEFLDDPGMLGLAELLEAAVTKACKAAGGSGKKDAAGSNGDARISGSGKGGGQEGKRSASGKAEGGEAGGGAGGEAEARGLPVSESSFRSLRRHGDAPLWGIMHSSDYAKRAKAAFNTLWDEAARRGVERLGLKGQA
ncbi:hypothetical protein Agub_g5809 [Astrephomene gubernaculifera]|uniref:Uncharacterized protein n=1 Tax=Astrephomene gubernaculifera TaxID=47775 RepID=A0AAD3HKY2_9CHLO|nr:hypothetical protein Agub_g5809 [Astrephomene gubernaculifera]